MTQEDYTHEDELQEIGEQADDLLVQLNELPDIDADIEALMGDPELVTQGDAPVGYDSETLATLSEALSALVPQLLQAVKKLREKRPEVLLGALTVVHHEMLYSLADRHPRKANNVEDCSAYLTERWILQREAIDEQVENDAAMAAAQTDLETE